MKLRTLVGSIPLVVVVGCAAGEPEPSPEPAPLPTVEANQSTPQQTKAIYPGTRAGCLQSCWDKLIGCMTLLCRSTKGVDGTIYSCTPANTDYCNDIYEGCESGCNLMYPP